MVQYWCPVPSSAPDDTELPRLTSDPLLRRSAGGEILIFCGPERSSRRAINPSNRPGPSKPGRVERPEFASAFFALRPNTLVLIRASERSDRPRSRPAVTPHSGGLLAFIRMPGFYLTPSNHPPYVMRFHVNTVSCKSVKDVTVEAGIRFDRRTSNGRQGSRITDTDRAIPTERITDRFRWVDRNRCDGGGSYRHDRSPTETPRNSDRFSLSAPEFRFGRVPRSRSLRG